MVRTGRGGPAAVTVMRGSLESLRFIAIDRTGAPSQACPEIDQTGRQACKETAALYERVGFVPPWLGYLVASDDRVVGICGYTGPPAAGRVEIAYFTFPEFESRGYATAMARELLERAVTTDPRVVVTAKTLPRTNASTRILEKLGFSRSGTVVDPDDGPVWEWVHPSGGRPASPPR